MKVVIVLSSRSISTITKLIQEDALVHYIWFTLTDTLYSIHYIRYNITISGTIFLLHYFCYTISGTLYISGTILLEHWYAISDSLYLALYLRVG